MLAWLHEAIAGRSESVAIAASRSFTYTEIARRVHQWRESALHRIPPGAVVAFEGDYGPGAISLLLALTLNRNVIVPLSRDVTPHHDEFATTAEVEYWIRSVEGDPELSATRKHASHPLYGKLRSQGNPGLVLFSSGSTGIHKCALHDMTLLLRKFAVPRHTYRTLVFLQLDHIGGINTLLYTLSNGGTAVVAHDRTPNAVCRAIAEHKVQLLPTSPTFLNLLLLAEEYLRHDLSCLEVITYGTEPMPASTLKRVAEAFPTVRLLQTYGLSELGILRSQSRSSDSLWVRVGGEGYETRVIEGRLWVRAESAMLGYLNAPSPFDADGFFDTGDLVDVDGDWLRFRGRESDVINVGGNKVYPAEVEGTLLEMPNVADAVVTAERNPIMGQVVMATVRLAEPENLDAFKARMRAFCAERLSAFKVPTRVRISFEPLHSVRFKRWRHADAQHDHPCSRSNAS
ncbi:MAG: ANL family adenylate-forming protein [Gammaproteobacteria bacterium]